MEYVVEVDFRVFPFVAEMDPFFAFRPIRDLDSFGAISAGIQALVEFAAEQLDTGNRENQPENQADQEYIENRWNRVHESINDDFHALPT